jgi:hypothetical protein
MFRPPAPPPIPKKLSPPPIPSGWEYSCRVLPLDSETIETSLNAAGASGWEAVSMVSRGWKKPEVVVLLKRRAQ